MRFMAFSAKCALGRAQFESPRYAAIESEVRVLVLAGDKITSLGKDRLAELDQWAYGMIVGQDE